jgi:hypothetical protein
LEPLDRLRASVEAPRDESLKIEAKILAWEERWNAEEAGEHSPEQPLGGRLTFA